MSYQVAQIGLPPPPLEIGEEPPVRIDFEELKQQEIEALYREEIQDIFEQGKAQPLPLNEAKKRGLKPRYEAFDPMRDLKRLFEGNSGGQIEEDQSPKPKDEPRRIKDWRNNPQFLPKSLENLA